MKKLVFTLIAVIMSLPVISVSAAARPLDNDFHTPHWERFSHNYEFYTDPGYDEILGTPTQTSIIPHDPSQDNVRRNAGAAFNPPPVGFFSGAFDTERNNIFAIQSPAGHVLIATDFANSGTTSMGFGGVGSASDGQMLPHTSTLGAGSGTGQGGVTITTQPSTTPQPPPANVTQRPNPELNSLVTAPSFFNDGSMARLTIPALRMNAARVFHGSGYNIIDYHIGHFPTTSAWDGNVGLLAHNGGQAGYFERLHTLSIGDEIIFQTPMGTRVYQVVSMQQINENDFSLLGWSHQNTLTLITCVRGQRNQRLAVVAVEQP